MRLTITVFPADRNQFIFNVGQVPPPRTAPDVAKSSYHYVRLNASPPGPVQAFSSARGIRAEATPVELLDPARSRVPPAYWNALTGCYGPHGPPNSPPTAIAPLTAIAPPRAIAPPTTGARPTGGRPGPHALPPSHSAAPAPPWFARGDGPKSSNWQVRSRTPRSAGTSRAACLELRHLAAEHRPGRARLPADTLGARGWLGDLAQFSSPLVLGPWAGVLTHTARQLACADRHSVRVHGIAADAGSAAISVACLTVPWLFAGAWPSGSPSRSRCRRCR